jgi:hypothetical protein
MRKLDLTCLSLACLGMALGCSKGKKDVSPKGQDDLAALIRENAATAIALMKREEGVDLCFDAESVALAESYIEKNRNRLDAETRAHFIVVFGAFLGETVIAVHGGEWVEHEDQGWGVKTRGGIIGFPFAKVAKLIDNGPEDSISSFLRLIPAIAEHSRIEREKEAAEPSPGSDADDRASQP